MSYVLLFLQTAPAVIFFINKVLVLFGRPRLGWSIGAVGALLAFVYFWYISTEIQMILQAGLIVLMTYGVVRQDKKDPRVEDTIKWLMIAVMFGFAIFASQGETTLIQLGSCFGTLISTRFLTNGPKNRKWGWLCYIPTHALTSVIAYEKEQDVYLTFQILSMVVAVLGVVKEMRGSTR